jgi:O-antigen/teichoic acid export membrane protein
MKKPRDSVARGALLVLAARWTDRVIGFVSTIILARLLVPEDIGIVAMASLVITLVDVLLDLGVNVALIQNRDVAQAHYDTAWTLRLAQTALATAVVFLGAPLAAAYFKDVRVQPVLQAMAFTFLLTGLENIGVIVFQKEMTFGADFRFILLKRIAGFVATVVAAWLLRSYWALVIGALAGRGIGTVISYFIHPMRPRFSLAKAREMFGMSTWLMARGIGNFVDANFHRFVVGGREAAGVMGAYSLGDDVSKLPTTTLLTPLNRVLFPAFVSAKHDEGELKRMFLIAQGIQTLIVLPAAMGLVLVAREAVLVLLGERWMSAVPFLQVLAPVGMVSSITNAGGYVLLALGRVRALTYIIWVRICLFAVLAYAVFPGAGALQIAWLRLAFAALAIGAFVTWVRQALPTLRVAEAIASIARPLIAAGVMSAAVLAVERIDFGASPVLVVLLIKIAVGAIAYVGSVLLAWRLAGRPAGAESYLLEKVARKRR